MAVSRRSDVETVHVASVATDLGWMAIAAGRAGVKALTIGRRSARRAVRDLPVDVPVDWFAPGFEDGIAENPAVSALPDRLKAYAVGQPDDFGDVLLDLGELTPFQRRVTQACRRVPWGKTVSYAELAARAGSPRAARAVGNVMASNRFPIVVPCHRVVGASSLGGYSAPSGLSMKRRLLRLEGSLPGASK